MGIIETEGVTFFGNYAGYSKKRPKDLMKDYKVMTPWEYHFSDWERPKLGKAVCNCVLVKEHYMFPFGIDIYHSDECNISKHLKKYPQIYNLIGGYDPLLIARSE